MSYYLIILIGVLSFYSCENDESEIEISLKYNETYYHAGGTFILQIDSVLNDSRCPKGSDCIWPGNAEIRFKITTLQNYEQLFKLNSYIDPKETVINGFNIELINVLPYPEENIIEQNEYIAVLRIRNVNY